MAFSDKIQSVWNKVCNWGGVVAAFAVMSTGFSSCGSNKASKIREQKKDSVENAVRVENPVRRIKYCTDTLSQRGRVLLYYSRGYITRNFVNDDNLYKMRLSLFSHEDWHAHNDEIKWRIHYKYTPFEYYKLCMHDEISANIAALLTVRYQYIASPDKKKFIEDNKNGLLGFYFKEVAKGKIKPESKNPKDLEREYSLIANGMQKAWMEKCAKGYMPSIYSMMQRYVGLFGLVDNSRKNYNFVRGYMYKIGGVDFSQYMKDDIVPSDQRVYIADGLRNVKSMRKGGAEVMDYVNNGYPLFKSLAIDKQREAFQHLLIAAQLKYNLRDKSAEELQQNPQIIDMYYRQVLSRFQKDKTFREYVDRFPIINEKSNTIIVNNTKEYEDIISSIYTFKGVDLSEAINDFNIARLPIKGPDFKEPYFKNTLYLWMYPIEMQAVPPSVVKRKYTGPIIEQTIKENSAPKSSKRRRSDWQYIEAPNYREPILVASSKEDNAKILKTIEDFKNIPDVLKECNVKAQQAYYASLEKVSQKENKRLNNSRRQMFTRRGRGGRRGR
ncbi:MAG: hypothetical protein IJ532_03820 [Alphaproteobacteria bacterium]|nr:hypothetical protein [Alphaproteobacteria bacterium]